MLMRLAGLFRWAYGVWVLLTWTLTAEQLLFGVFVALVVVLALAPLSDEAGPWRLLRPRTVAGGAWLLIAAAGRVALANGLSSLPASSQ
jgi:multicomponent Na+:H+ antiporter subunit E